MVKINTLLYPDTRKDWLTSFCAGSLFLLSSLASTSAIAEPSPLNEAKFSGPISDMNSGDSPEIPVQAAETATPRVAGQAEPTEIRSMSLAGLIDREVQGPDTKTIGRIIDVLSGQDGQIEAVVLDVGGFLGVGNRRVAVAWALIHSQAGNPLGPLLTRIPRDIINSAPAYDPDTTAIQVVWGPVIPKPQTQPPSPPASVTISTSPHPQVEAGENAEKTSKTTPPEPTTASKESAPTKQNEPTDAQHP
ncbi:MAG: PRC-barrel domain-containing protein [Acetobacter sp.]|jgi:hypothetical protein